jgi:hypothetical protein
MKIRVSYEDEVIDVVERFEEVLKEFGIIVNYVGGDGNEGWDEYELDSQEADFYDKVEDVT